MYNEMVVLKLTQSMTKLIQSPPEIFREQIVKHFQNCGVAMYERIKGWMELSNTFNNEMKNINQVLTDNDDGGGVAVSGEKTTHTPPEFPLVPASRGFCLTLAGLLENYYKKLEALRDE